MSEYFLQILLVDISVYLKLVCLLGLGRFAQGVSPICLCQECV
jgi:hypothetical protein